MKKKEVEIVMWNWGIVLSIILALAFLFGFTYMVMAICVDIAPPRVTLIILTILLIFLNGLVFEIVLYLLEDVKKVYKVVGREIK